MQNGMFRRFIAAAVVCASPAVGLSQIVAEDPIPCDPELHVPSEYASIQEAIDAACPGTAVVVAPGTYTESFDFGGKAVTVRSADGAATTLLDGEGLRGVLEFISGEGPGSVLEGFTITGGSALPFFLGGGLLIEASSPTIRDCVLTGNIAGQGGAVFIGDGAGPVFESCEFTNNDAVIGNGGAIFMINASATLVDCMFAQNTCDEVGGAIAAAIGTLNMSGCEFRMNDSSGDGGAVFTQAMDGVFDGCTFEENTAQFGGGGIFGLSSTITLSSSSLCDNLPADIAGTFLDGGDNSFCNSCTDERPLISVPGDYATIQEALDAACDGATIRVDTGTFTGPINFRGKAVRLTTRLGPRHTEIVGGGVGPVVVLGNLEGPESILEGFTIQGGTPAPGRGGGLYVYGSPRIRHCRINSNNGPIGGGAQVDGGNPSFEAVEFGSNSAGIGAAAYTAGHSMFDGCLFIDNSSGIAGAGLTVRSSGSATIRDTRFCRNSPVDIDGEWIDAGGNRFVATCCGRADLTAPFGVLDLFDLIEFLDQHSAGKIGADLATPYDIWDVFDILEFIFLYEEGCDLP